MKKVLSCRQESLHKSVEQPKCKTSATLDSLSPAHRAQQLFGGLRLGKRTRCTQQQHRATKPQFQTSITEFQIGGRGIFAAVTASLGFRQFEQPRRNSKDSRHSKPEGPTVQRVPKRIKEISNYSFGITKHWLPLNAPKLRIWSKCAAATCANKKSWLSSACVSKPWYAILVVTVLKICGRRPPHRFGVFPPNNRGMSSIFCVSKLLPPYFAYSWAPVQSRMDTCKTLPKDLGVTNFNLIMSFKALQFLSPRHARVQVTSPTRLYILLLSRWIKPQEGRAETNHTKTKTPTQTKKHNSQTCKKGEQVTHEVKK